MQITTVGVITGIGVNNRIKNTLNDQTGLNNRANLSNQYNSNPVAFKGWFSDMIYYFPKKMRKNVTAKKPCK